MQRITKKFLLAQIKNLNGMFDRPNEPYALNDDGTIARDKDGKCLINVGTYTLSQAYGGYSLEKMSEGGGVSCPLGLGHVPARALSDALAAYMAGIRDAREQRA